MLERGRRTGIAVALAGGAFLAACGGSPLAPPDAAARVDDQMIPYADFEGYVSVRVGLETVASSEVLSGLLDQYLDELLLRALALDGGHVDDGAVGRQVVEALLADRAAGSVTDEEVASFYRAYPDSFERPERVVLNQVLAERSDIAARVAARLGEGDDIAALNRVFGDDASINQSEITREDLPVAFVDRIFELEDGEVSEVIEADYGYHVFQVVARLPAERWSIEEARPRIVEQLDRRARRRALENLVAEARGRYNVEVFARNLPFNYEGQYDAPNS